MAIVITSNSGKTHYALQQYVCDTNADIIDLPVDNVWVGSTAFVIDSGETYMLNSALNWVKVDLGGGGKGGNANIVCHTTQEWETAGTATSKINTIYIYTDYSDDIPGIKIGDGTTTINNLSFVGLDKMDKVNPTGSGYFSLNRKADSVIGINSFAEGYNNIASGVYAHAEGQTTTASGDVSHAEGHETIASSLESHAEGCNTKATAHFTHAEGHLTEAKGESAHAQGNSTMASGNYSHAEGNGTTASDSASHAEGGHTISSGSYSHAEGDHCQATSNAAHAEGFYTVASGGYSHAEGNHTTASYTHAHAEGQSTTASANAAHAEGLSTTASAESAHSEGTGTQAKGIQSHAEGVGSKTGTDAVAAHAEGQGTEANGTASHAEGLVTKANRRSQHVFGEYNISDASGTTATRGTYVEIVGNGTGTGYESNARTLDWSGNEVLAGKLTVGAQPTAANDVTTKSYVDAISTDVTNVTNTVNTLLGPQATKLHEWILDSTTAPFSIDTIDGTSQIRGDTITATNDYWQIDAGHSNICSTIGLLIPNKEIEIEFATCEPTFTTSQIRGLIGFVWGVGNGGELSYYSSLCWDATNNCFSNYDRDGFVKTLPDFNSIDGFSNGTMKLFVNSSNSVDVYVNNVLVGNFDPQGYQYLTFGIPLDAPYYTLRVKRITVYSGSNGEDILGRISNLETNALPAVTSSDNGKLLQVVSGAWTAVDLNGNNIQY